MKLSRENVRSVLHECGPMTMRELSKFFPDVPYQNVGSAISAMRKRVAERQIYIASWTREGIGRKYLRAVYALGKKRDARKPPVFTEQERSQARRDRQRVQMPQVAVTSVFNWGQHEQR